jgi:hypothetical protein
MSPIPQAPPPPVAAEVRYTRAMRERPTTVAGRIRRAAKGLSFQSETDAPVEPCRLRGYGGTSLTADDLVAHLGLAPDTPRAETSLDDFFASQVEEEEWFELEDRERAARFRALVEALRELDDVRVYKLGDRSIAVFVLGRNAAGRFVGVKTRVVET